MTLEELTHDVLDLTDWPHSETIKLFAWYLHAQQAQERFSGADIGRCYDQLHLQRPASIGPYIAQLEKKKPKEILRDSKGLYLAKHVRDEVTAKYGHRPITVQVTKLLSDLPAQVPDLAERTYLDEALVCLRYGAPRAAIVMTWNLAYHHLCDYVLRSKLVEFNRQWPAVYQGHHRRGPKTISKMEDFAEELKESEVIEVCNSASVFTKDVHKILVEKLGKRNSAAHPSSVNIGQLQAEAFIDDLVKNVVLKLT